MSLMRGSLFGGSLFAGLLFSHLRISIGVFGPPESDAKHIIYVCRNITELWAGDYHALSVASNPNNFDVAAASALQWHPAEREIVVAPRYATVAIGGRDRLILIQADGRDASAKSSPAAEAHAKDVLYIQSLFRLAVVGSYRREVAVGESARVVNVPTEEAVTT